MIWKRGIAPFLVHASFCLVFTISFFLTAILSAQQNSQSISPILLDGQSISKSIVSVCADLRVSNSKDSTYINCVAKQLIIYKMYNELSIVDIEWTDDINNDTLKFYSKAHEKTLKITQSYLKGIPIIWHPNLDNVATLKNDLNFINNRLAILDLGELSFTIYRTESESLKLDWYLKNKSKSYVDFIAGFGNINNNDVGVFGQGQMELNHILSPFSKTHFQFERLSQRNTVLALNHQQLSRVFLLGPNSFMINLSQRDSLFRRNEIQLNWDFIQKNNFVYSVNLFYQSATVSNNVSEIQSLNTGLHQSRGLGLSVSFNNRNPLKWVENTSFGFSMNFDQMFKNYQPNQTNLSAFRNKLFTRVGLKSSATYVYWNSTMALYTKLQLYAVPTSINLSAAEVLTTGGLNSIRAYFENQFLAKDAAIATFENRFKLDSQSYFFLFSDLARLNINQEIIGSAATNWDNKGQWRTVFSGGLGVRLFGNQIQTQAIIAFSNQTGLFNPRVHLGIVRLF